VIFTFYSFKGGVGRSMALANVAEWLYLQGLRVVMIDWDLEAPGLERFFFSAEDVELVKSRPGLMDLLLMYQRQFLSIPIHPNECDDERVQTVLAEYLLPITSVLQPVSASDVVSTQSRGTLWLLSSGCRSGENFSSYAENVQDFNWKAFYDQYRGAAYFEWLRNSLLNPTSTDGGTLQSLVDVVLIDARTGVTEMGGVCTRQLADVVVVFCAPNTQNLEGSVTMAESFRRQQVLDERKGRLLKVIVVPTRLETGETDKLNEFRAKFTADVAYLTPFEFRRLKTNFWDLRIPYIPKYAYAEERAIGVPGRSVDLENAYKMLSAHLTLMAPEGSALRIRCVDEFKRIFKGAIPRVAITYAGTTDLDLARKLGNYLQSQGVSFSLADIAPADDTQSRPATVSVAGAEYCIVVLGERTDAVLVTKQLWPVRRLGITIVPVFGDHLRATSSMPAWLRYVSSFRYTLEQEALAEFVRRPRAVVAVPSMVPPLPERYVVRSDFVRDVRIRIADVDNVQPTRKTVVLCGAAGAGKSVLAAAICHDDAVLMTFPDGILWVNVGQSGPDAAALGILHTLLTGEQRRFSSATEAGATLATDLTDRTCLIVIDNAQDPDSLAIVLQATAGSTRLVMTRNLQLAAAFDFVQIGAMQPKEAKEMLIDSVSSAAPQDVQALCELARACGEWPLLLSTSRSIVQRRVTRGDSYTAALAYVAQNVVSLDALDYGDAGAAKSIRSAIESSIQSLPDSDRQRFDDLAIFARLDEIPVDDVAAIWNCDLRKTEQNVTRLADEALLDYDLAAKVVRVNPLMRLHLAKLQQLRRLPTESMAPLGTLTALASLPTFERKHDFFPALPIDRNRFFTGRESLLQQLHAALAVQDRVALSGLGGVGKTQTAVEYAYLHGDEYAVIFWVSAETEGAINRGFVEIARLLALWERDAKDERDAVAGAKRWLETHPGWLLIVDNADEPNLLKPVLPRGSQGRVLLTSRAQVFDMLGITKPIEIRELPRDEALQFLWTRTGRNGTNPQEHAAAQALAQELGCLPLALEQAAAFIVANQSRFADYLDNYRTRRLKLLERGVPIDDPTKSITTNWQLAFDELEATPASSDLLRASAFLDPDRIPLELVTEGASELGPAVTQALPNTKDELALDELLAPLTRYSLIRRELDSRSFSLHRLVQDVVREALDAETERIWAERVIAAVNTAFPWIQYETWAQCERLLPHAVAAVRLIIMHSFASKAAARLLNQTATYMRERARYAEAQPLYERALAIQEKVLGPDHPDVAMSLNNLANLHRAQGRYVEARPLYERALAIREKALGPDHLDVAASLNNLGELNYKQGRYADVQALYERALAIREKALGPYPLDVARSLNNLALLYDAQGRYAEAQPLYERALAIQENALGPGVEAHGDVGLAVLHRAKGRYAEAQPLVERALAIQEKALGPDHPDIATSLNNLGELHYKQGRYVEAQPLYERALAIQEKALGPGHPNVAVSLNNLAVLHRAQGRYAEAQPLYERVLAIQENALGPDHPDIATSLGSVALRDGRVDARVKVGCTVSPLVSDPGRCYSASM
jgi:tetratricopeptide (TPR) repeat protein